MHWRSGGLEVVRAVSGRISTAGKRRLPVHAATVILEEADPEFDDPVAIGRISGQGARTRSKPHMGNGSSGE